MEESESVPLKNISNSIIVRESARKLISKSEYDTRGISLTGANTVQNTEHSSAISTELYEPLVSIHNENGDYSSANQTLFKTQQVEVSIKGDIFNNGTNSCNKEKYRERRAHVPLNKLDESRSLMTDLSASSKFNIHVENGHSDNVDNKTIANISSILVPSGRNPMFTNNYSVVEDNFVSTDTNVEVPESLENFSVGPSNRGQECDKSPLFETPHSLKHLFSGTDSINKVKSQEQRDPEIGDYLEVSKCFRVDLSVSSKFNVLVEKHCDDKVSDQPVAGSSSIPALSDNQHEISQMFNNCAENLTSTDVLVLQSSTLQKDWLVSSLNIGQRCDENCLVDAPQSSVNVPISMSQQHSFSGTDSVKSLEQCDHETVECLKEPTCLRADLSVSSKFNFEKEQCDDNVQEVIADSSSIPGLSNSHCEIFNRANEFAESLTSIDAMVLPSSTHLKDLPVGSLLVGQKFEHSSAETPDLAENIPSLMNNQILCTETVSVKEKSPKQCDLETVDNSEGPKSFRADLSVSNEFCDLVKNEHCEVKVRDKPIGDSSYRGIQIATSNKPHDSLENLTSTDANVIVSQPCILKNLPISPLNDQKREVEIPLTSTPHYINPFSKRGKRCKKSISEKINEIVVEVEKINETTNHISCDHVDNISVSGIESKLELPKGREGEGSNVNIKNASSPLVGEEVSRGISRNFFSPPTISASNVVNRNFFSPPTKVHVESEVDKPQIVYEKVRVNSSNFPEESLETQIRKLKENVSKAKKKNSPIRYVTKTPKDSKYKDGMKKSSQLKSKENIHEEESKKAKESAINACFVSDDPCENEDNNNPEWLVLKKLETDEARYKAVRKRWKNLTIPDPNKNLTYIQIKSCFKRPSAPENVGVKKVSHKRAFSYEPSTSTEDLPPAKRSRTRSCTTSYDKKIEDHRRNMEVKERDLLSEREKSMWEVRSRFNKARSRLLDSGLQFLNYREYENRLSQLRSQQRQGIEEIYRKYLNAKMELENEGYKKSKIFNAALEEVKAFHNFYSNLDDKVNDCYFLTEPELEDVEDTNKLYQKFFSFYSC